MDRDPENVSTGDSARERMRGPAATAPLALRQTITAGPWLRARSRAGYKTTAPNAGFGGLRRCSVDATKLVAAMIDVTPTLLNEWHPVINVLIQTRWPHAIHRAADVCNGH